MMDKYTFDDLIARKLQREAAREKYKEIQVGEKALLFRRPKEKELLSIMDQAAATEGAEGGIRVMDQLIYLCCPALQDPQLHDALQVVDPDDVPAALFSIAQRQKLGEQLFDFCEIGEMTEDIKNE